MNNDQSNNDYDKDLSWSENPEDFSSEGEEEEKEDKKRLLAPIVKAFFMMLIALAVLVFVGIAWFALNKETGTSGMSIKSHDNGFELQVSSGTIGNNDLYEHLDGELTGNSGTITNTGEGGQVISWRLEDGETAIKPGSQGMLQFNVISKGADINSLTYNLHITSYTATTHTEPDPADSGTTIEVVDNLTEVTSGSSGSLPAAMNYINGHVLFFTGRDGNSKADYKYYGFISNKEAFNLTLNNGTGTIYWIWPNTFGQTAFSTGESDYISGTPVLYKSAESYITDRAAVTDYMITNQASFFSGPESSYSSLITTMYDNWEDPPTSYKAEFDKLSEGYNEADQTIGNNLDYVLLQMVVDAR